MKLHTQLPDEPAYYGHAEEKKDWKNPNSDLGKVLETLRGAKNMLEIGCGMAEIVPQLPTGLEYAGIDPSSFCINTLSDKYPQDKFAVGYAENLPFPDSYFDRVFSSNVLEHVYDPQKALKEMVRVAKVGGKIIIMAPNHESPRSRLEAIRHYSSLRKIVFTFARMGDFFLRFFGMLRFRTLKDNFTSVTGKYERSDDDLVYITSAYEISKKMRQCGCTELYCRPFPDNGSWKKKILKLFAHGPLRYQGRGIFFIFEKK